ncbi:MAG: aldo/keto reductase [Actinobacteria bacterium HGW-Actinobacteria-4]|nr:MAG: aldo/keto reductase [Actinobacteria bacterium HGW-Actinobacteria-4]
MLITRVGFGAWAIGGGGWAYAWGAQADDESVRAIVHAVERGVNWVDTAAVYGLGHSEVVTGQALKAIPEADRPLVFTKGGLRWDSAKPMEGARRVGEPESIIWEVEQSLKRLGVERIDLYQMHWPADDGHGVEVYWPVFAELMDSGKVRAIGLSNHNVAMLDSAEAIAHVNSLQPPFNMLNRGSAADVIPWAHAHNTGVIVYSPMASGVLTGTWSVDKARGLPDDDWRRNSGNHAGEHLERNLELVERLRPIAARHGATVGAIAIAWTLTFPGVTGAIVGGRSPEQVDGWVNAGDIELTGEDLTQIRAALTDLQAGDGPLEPVS